ncbi:hypothetical protein [Marinobacter fonticola]|uniref:hypothetical protein n=1 Tax=Marinobacter fonticola TaxID=2603215 RepID=UPI00143E0D10|nr:hypothetical protein [Marinobacter fonticola]
MKALVWRTDQVGNDLAVDRPEYMKKQVITVGQFRDAHVKMVQRWLMSVSVVLDKLFY